MKRLHLQPTESEMKQDALRAGYREFFEDWILNVPFQWAVTIHYPYSIRLEIFERRIKNWIRKIMTLYFKPTLGAMGVLVEGENAPHAHLLLYGKNLKGGGFDSNGNSILEQTVRDMQKAENVWVKLNGRWTEPSHRCSSEPDFISPPKERSINIQPIYDPIGSARYFTLEKNIHVGHDHPSEFFCFYPDFLKKTAEQIKQNTNRTEPDA